MVGGGRVKSVREGQLLICLPSGADPSMASEYTCKKKPEICIKSFLKPERRRR